MITWMLIVIAGLAVWHYVWDGILAPSFRAQCRFRLFALRDRVREMKYQGDLDERRFRYLNDSINAAVQVIVPSITITALAESERAIKNNPELGRLIDERLAYLVQSPNPEVGQILASVVRTGYHALFINSGGWFILTVPIMLIVVPICVAHTLIERLVALTEKEVLNAIPEAFHTADLQPQ